MHSLSIFPPHEHSHQQVSAFIIRHPPSIPFSIIQVYSSLQNISRDLNKYKIEGGNQSSTKLLLPELPLPELLPPLA